MDSTLQQFEPDNRKFGGIVLGALCVVILLFIIAGGVLALMAGANLFFPVF